MKKVKFFILLALFNVAGLTTLISESKIDIKGKLAGGTNRNPSQSQPLEVNFNGNELTVNFLDCLGVLKVVVKDENGVIVFNQTVNTCVTNSVSIDVTNWNSGNYIIVISDLYGCSVEGEFVIN